MKKKLLINTAWLCALALLVAGCGGKKRKRPAPNPSNIEGRLQALESQTAYIQKEFSRLDEERRERQKLARRIEAVENQMDRINHHPSSSTVGESPLDALPKPSDVGSSLPERRPPPENPLPSVAQEEVSSPRQQPSPTRSYSFRERTAEELFDLGSRHYNAGELGEAVEKLRLYLERGGKAKRADEALYLIGRAELARGRPYAASMNFRQLIDVHPRSPWRPDALFYGGEAYYRLFDKVQALRLWKELEARYPSHPLAPNAREAIRQMATER